MTFQVNDGKAKSCAKSRINNVLNIETPMTAILSGDNSPTATILYPQGVTTLLNILYVNDGKATRDVHFRRSNPRNRFRF